MNLNTEQQAVVDSESKQVFVVAGPGSGKTHTLVERIKEQAKIVNPNGIVVITFTNAGANELRKRLDVDVRYIGTLHGFCFRMLAQNGEKLGYRKGISILPEDQRESLLIQVAKFLSIKCGKKKLLQDPPDAIKAEYLFRLKTDNMIDFDGILTEGLKLIQMESDCPFHSLYVDEAQDSGPVDWKIYEALKCHKKFFVGDYDQSIYGFRGAVPHEFMRRAKKNGFLTLQNNYRSDIEICTAGNNIIGLCEDRIKKEIIPVSEKWGTLHFSQWDDEMEEMRYIAGKCLQIPMESAVLVRTNALVKQLRDGLDALGVPIKADPYSVLPQGFMAARALISCWQNRFSTLSARRFMDLIGFPEEIINKRALECQISGAPLTSCREFPQDFWLTNKEMKDIPTLLAKAKVPAEAVAVVASRIKEVDIPTLNELAVDLAGYEDWTASVGGRDGVEIMTIHRAKGREWDRVFLPAWEDGVIPMTSGEPNEEIRLAFVAVTRARHDLFITCSQYRKTQWGRKESEPSIFYKELVK